MYVQEKYITCKIQLRPSCYEDKLLIVQIWWWFLLSDFIIFMYTCKNMFSLLSNSFYLYMYRKPIHVANSLIWGPVGSNPSTAYLFNSSVFHMGGLHCHPNHYLSSLNFVSNKPHLLTLKVVWDPGLMIFMWIKVHYFQNTLIDLKFSIFTDL